MQVNEDSDVDELLDLLDWDESKEIEDNDETVYPEFDSFTDVASTTSSISIPLVYGDSSVDGSRSTLSTIPQDSFTLPSSHPNLCQPEQMLASCANNHSKSILATKRKLNLLNISKVPAMIYDHFNRAGFHDIVELVRKYANPNCLYSISFLNRIETFCGVDVVNYYEELVNMFPDCTYRIQSESQRDQRGLWLIIIKLKLSGTMVEAACRKCKLFEGAFAMFATNISQFISVACDAQKHIFRTHELVLRTSQSPIVVQFETKTIYAVDKVNCRITNIVEKNIVTNIGTFR